MSVREFASEAVGWRNSADRWKEISFKARYKTLTEPEEFSSLAEPWSAVFGKAG